MAGRRHLLVYNRRALGAYFVCAATTSTTVSRTANRSSGAVCALNTFQRLKAEARPTASGNVHQTTRVNSLSATWYLDAATSLHTCQGGV
ncbi:hypothetical protein OBBRIDRAFT_185751 [Obba rivulosa]|uniref:Uncharacterized protein n=1 Tax=Obba rivulosa TaxID=1052685 RepID=A0A8E2DHH8_9APHY|nr:hypothetical protein OBBRIDRAFT_185751 [Obba rivulosa]